MIVIKTKSRPENYHYATEAPQKKTTPADRVIKKLLRNMIMRLDYPTGCRAHEDDMLYYNIILYTAHIA